METKKKNKKYKFYINTFEYVNEWHIQIRKAQKLLIQYLDLDESECDMRLHSYEWVAREQIVVEGPNVRLAHYIGEYPTGRYESGN